MDWLDRHQGAVTGVSAAAVCVAVLLLAWLVLRALGQGRIAQLGARPVPRPPEFAAGADGGLCVVVPLANASPWPAQQLRVEARIDGRRTDGGLRGVTLFGGGPGVPLAAAACRPSFPWPVGVLDATVEVRWAWRDGAGRHRARWQGAVRVPEQALPPGA
ncbi:MAG: hypothetical protein IT200_02885 [Thermoleophilia bacterium]|nr:hypothetical protein [Thermoleophilia bacterium]